MAIRLTKLIQLKPPFAAGSTSVEPAPVDIRRASGSVLFVNRFGGGIRLKNAAGPVFGAGDTSFKIVLNAGWSERAVPGILYQFGNVATPKGVIVAVNKVSGVDKLIFCVANTASSRLVATCNYPNKSGLVKIEILYNSGGSSVTIKIDGVSQSLSTTGSYNAITVSGSATLACGLGGCILANVTGISSSVIGTGWTSSGTCVNTFGGRIGGFTYTSSLADNAEKLDLSFEKNRNLPNDKKSLLSTTTMTTPGDIAWINPPTGTVLTIPTTPSGILWNPDQSRLRQRNNLRD